MVCNHGYFSGKKLAADGKDIGPAYLSQSIGAIIAPFIIGLIADKFFSAQKILAVLHVIGGALLWYASMSNDFSAFFPLLLFI